MNLNNLRRDRKRLDRKRAASASVASVTYTVKDDRPVGPNVNKLRSDVERRLGPQLLFGCEYEADALAFNIAGVRKDAKQGSITMPRTHEEWVAAIVCEYKANLGALAGANIKTFVNEHGAGFTVSKKKAG